MANIVVYTWLCRPFSRSGWAIHLSVREETQKFRVIVAPPPSWYTSFGEREQERRRIPPFLHNVLSNIRAATHGFTEAPEDFDHDGELAESVLAALLVVQSVRIIPGMAQPTTCLMCTSPITDRMPRTQNPARVSMEHRHTSSCGFWTLHEFSIFPSWREDVYSRRLCAFHASEFIRALDAVLLGFLDPPVRRTLARRHSF